MGLDFSILFWAGLAIGGVAGVIVGGLMPWLWPFALALAGIGCVLYVASLLIGDAL